MLFIALFCLFALYLVYAYIAYIQYLVSCYLFLSCYLSLKRAFLLFYKFKWRRSPFPKCVYRGTGGSIIADLWKIALNPYFTHICKNNVYMYKPRNYGVCGLFCCTISFVSRTFRALFPPVTDKISFKSLTDSVLRPSSWLLFASFQ